MRASVRVHAYIVLLCSLGPPMALCDTLPQELRDVAKGYEKNRRMFSSHKCEFTVRRGLASSIDDAIEGRLKDVVMSTGMWVVSGDFIKYVLRCDEDYLRSEVENAGSEIRQGTGALCRGTAFLRNGEFSLRYSQRIGGANLLPKNHVITDDIRITPFSMNVMGKGERSSPGNMLDRAASGEFVATFDGNKVVLGVPTVVVRVGKSKDDLTLTMCLDPHRGYLPIKMTDVDEAGEGIYEAYVTKVMHCSNDRWVPERSVVIWSPDNPPPYRVQEISISNLDETTPDRNEFYIDVGENTQISVPRESAYMYLSQNERIYAHELDRIYDRSKEHVANIYAPLLNSRAPSARRRILIYVNIVVVIVCLGVVITRRYAQLYRKPTPSECGSGDASM